ncbi:uncharacterized protein VTP21DRAFT_11057 [Calcarisporiella thermophila]|uniref:uncharacterized protein n=1 Tax=Calcarisporiella thermophila TaxID=911321 RepID=UPI003742F9CD
MLKLVYLLLLSYIGFALAQKPFITQPVTGTVWKAGETQQIIWNNGAPGPITIKLLKGNPAALQLVTVLSSSVDGASGSFTWNIPNSLPVDNTYAIALGNEPNVAYSGQFTVLAASCVPTCPPDPPTSAPAAQPTSGTSSSASPGSAQSQPAQKSSASGVLPAVAFAIIPLLASLAF